jgi:hypothetical protein
MLFMPDNSFLVSLSYFNFIQKFVELLNKNFIYLVRVCKFAVSG